MFDVTIPRRSFVFGQSRAKVSAGFTNVRSLEVAAFDLVHCSLSVLHHSLRLLFIPALGWGVGGGVGGGERRGLRPRNDVFTTCTVVTLQDGQRIIAVFFPPQIFLDFLEARREPVEEIRNA